MDGENVPETDSESDAEPLEERRGLDDALCETLDDSDGETEPVMLTDSVTVTVGDSVCESEGDCDAEGDNDAERLRSALGDDEGDGDGVLLEHADDEPLALDAVEGEGLSLGL